eukprot:TRINITY_DN48435_c0_g1_i1.p1 TRINITY_DN48435_c0_g1~~TRINITY_DN48435_c0_g1_i1.p1  ORF type:complete len:625 (-),score=87.90 TRINITY_DN48435_c0_g1_i1:118-1776(-)
MEGADSPRRPKFEVEHRMIKVQTVWADPNFPLACLAFFSLRLVRPILLGLCFPAGPHTEDTAAEFAIVCAWLVSFVGFGGALLTTSSFQRWVEESQGVPDVVKSKLDHTALAFLFAAFFADVLHQIIAIASWNYFWSIGIVDRTALNSGGKMPVAYVLVLLHVCGLVGAVIFVVMYARSVRASWAEMGKRWERRGSLRGHRQGFCDDLESGMAAGGRRVANEDVAADAAAPDSARERPSGYRQQRVAAPAGSEENSGPRQAGRENSPRPSESDNEHQGTPRRRPSKRSSSPRANSKRSNSPRAGAASAAPGVKSCAPNDPQPERPERPPLGTPPKAWLWVGSDCAPCGGEWVRVRVLRSSASDGTAAVRMPGGNVVQTRQSLLRKRASDDDEPPSAPAAGPRDRPASADPGPRGGFFGARPSPRYRQRSKERPSSADLPRGSRQDKGPSAPPGWAPLFKDDDKPDKEEPPKVESEEERWARERMAKLRKELQELDAMTPVDRRLRLRALQRELHPDKLSPELRPHAQPLFHLVQKEWEVNEAKRAEAHIGGA